MKVTEKQSMFRYKGILVWQKCTLWPITCHLCFKTAILKTTIHSPINSPNHMQSNAYLRLFLFLICLLGILYLYIILKQISQSYNTGPEKAYSHVCDLRFATVICDLRIFVPLLFHWKYSHVCDLRLRFAAAICYCDLLHPCHKKSHASAIFQ